MTDEPKKVRPPLFYDVPSNTKPAKCKSCDATIYFVPGKKAGSLVPVRCDVEGGRPPFHVIPGQMDLLGEPATPQVGRGLSHFADCPDAARFRRD